MPLSLSITAGLTLSRNSRLSAPGTDREPVKGRYAYLVDGHVSSSYQSLGSRAKAHRQGWGDSSLHTPNTRAPVISRKNTYINTSFCNTACKSARRGRRLEQLCPRPVNFYAALGAIRFKYKSFVFTKSRVTRLPKRPPNSSASTKKKQTASWVLSIFFLSL